MEDEKIKMTYVMIDGKMVFKDQFSNIYDEKFQYVNKEEKKRKKMKIIVQNEVPGM